MIVSVGHGAGGLADVAATETDMSSLMIHAADLDSNPKHSGLRTSRISSPKYGKFSAKSSSFRSKRGCISHAWGKGGSLIKKQADQNAIWVNSLSWHTH